VPIKGACRCSTEPTPLSHYVVVRSDLPRGLLAAQVVHAAGESSPGPVPPGTHAVVLAAATQGALEEVSQRLTAAGVTHARVVESDAPYTDQLMAIGVPPARKEDIRRHLSALPLLR